MADADSDNLLAALHRWASGQDENFITEAFAYLLRHLLRRSPPWRTTHP